MSGTPAPLTDGLVELKTYRDWNGDCQWHTLIFHNNGFFKWWVKVLVRGNLPESITSLGYLKRRSAFEKFIQAIDFCQLQLLDDTMSKIILTMTESKTNASIPIRQDLDLDSNYRESPYVAIIHQMRYETLVEDPDRVIYPPTYQIQLEGLGRLRDIDAGRLQNPQLIAPAVSTITLDHQKFAYKTINRPIYETRDTEDIVSEINALAQFRGEANIAQIIALVSSENPYKTSASSKMTRVITGFLLEYYPEGSLLDCTMANEDIVPVVVVHDRVRIKWAIQVGNALRILHAGERTHLDIKPSNIVLDDEWNVFLIDIGGAGCYTWEWLCPEMQAYLEMNTEQTPADACLDMRVATDCWAYGRLISFIATNDGSGGTVCVENCEMLGTI